MGFDFDETVGSAAGLVLTAVVDGAEEVGAGGIVGGGGR
jgi:hypothetical protein